MSGGGGGRAEERREQKKGASSERARAEAREGEADWKESTCVGRKAQTEVECVYARARAEARGEGEMAEEGTPPLAAAWKVEQVAAWVLTLEEIDGLEAVAAKVREEEVDGFTLLAYKNKQEVKDELEISGGKAARLFAAIEQLRAAPGAPAVAPAGGGAAPTAYASHGPGTEVWTHADSLLQNTWLKHGLDEFTRLIEVKEIQNAPKEATIIALSDFSVIALIFSLSSVSVPP